MCISELLSAQRRWGKARSRKLIQHAGLKETKELGSMTERQRRVLASALEAKATASGPARTAWVARYDPLNLKSAPPDRRRNAPAKT